MPYRPILATLGYVMSPGGTSTLLVHRTKRGDDQHNGKYNGLGGKMEHGESAVDCIVREIREEAGIECVALTLRGTINWPGFGGNGEDWFGFIFRIDEFRGEPFEDNDDGPLEWVAIDALEQLPMWEGDRFFLPLVFGDDPRQFHGVMPYDNNRPVSWVYSWL